MERGQNGRDDFFGARDPFAGFGGFGRHGSLISGFFGGRDPFDDPFFTQPFGSRMGGPSMFGPSLFGPMGAPFGDMGSGGFLEQAPPTSNGSMPIITELDEGEGENAGRTNDQPNHESYVQEPDDGNDGMQGGQIQQRRDFNGANGGQPQAPTFTYQSSSVTYGGINGAYYTASKTRRTGSDGIAVEESKEADTTTKEATHRISRGIHDKNSLDWKLDDNLRIICELFAEQANKGNRPNTHMNSVGYAEVQKKFKELTGIELKRGQIKNKWDKLREKYKIWNKLLARQTGKGWDYQKGTINMDTEWWKKMRNEIPGSWPFRLKGLEYEDKLKEAFGPTIDGEDHWSPALGIPPIAPTLAEGTGTNDLNGDENEDEDDEVEEVTPSPININDKRASQSGVANEKNKKTKTGTATMIHQEIKRIADSASSVAANKVGSTSIKQVMDLVLDCGAAYGSDEHYIATSLFVRAEEREMFLTLPTPEIRFQWLTRKYKDKYGN